MKISHSVLFAVILGLASCEYEPSGENFSDIEEPRNAPPIEIDLNAEGDTITISQFGSLFFKFQTADRKFYGAILCIADHCEQASSESGGFNIGIFDVKPGTHVLTIEVFTGTGSGSIADVLEYEGFFYYKTWTLIVQEWSSDWSGLLTVNPDKGSLKLNWEKYNGANFKEYVVRKSMDWGADQTWARISDPEVTSFYDTSYIGGEAGYKIELVTHDTKLQSNSINYKDKIPKVYIKEVNNNLMTLAWDRSEYINNIKRYEIHKRLPDLNYELVAEINDPNDTSYVLGNLMFLHEYEFVFLPIAKQMDNYLSHFHTQMVHIGSKAVGYIGDKFEAGTIVTPMGDFFYYPFMSYIYEYNYILGESTIIVQLSNSSPGFSVSSNRKYLLATDDFMSVLFYDINLKKTKNYSPEQLSADFRRVSFPAISDNGIGIIYLFHPTTGSGANILIYDFINDRKIFQGQTDYLSHPFKISADGKYFYGLNQVFEIQTDTILIVPEITNEIENSSFFDFNMNDNELIAYGAGDYLYIKKISDLSTISQCYISGYKLNIDYNTNKILIMEEEKLLIYDITSCEEIWSSPVSSEAKFHYSYLRLSYNTLYDSSLGIKLTIE